ncbi:M23 family peptidase, partial [Pseudomonas syringae]
GKPVLVVKEQNNWLAIVGVPLTVKPGTQQISSGNRNLSFTVGSKKYPEQRITLKNKQQVNPDPENLKRIEGELAEQIQAYRSFSPN